PILRRVTVRLHADVESAVDRGHRTADVHEPAIWCCSGQGEAFRLRPVHHFVVIALSGSESRRELIRAKITVIVRTTRVIELFDQRVELRLVLERQSQCELKTTTLIQGADGDGLPIGNDARYVWCNGLQFLCMAKPGGKWQYSHKSAERGKVRVCCS